LSPGDILGHEAMGVVTEVGPADIANLAPGDRVVIPFNISCGHCWMCGRGLYAQCETTQVREQGKGAALFGYTSLVDLRGVGGEVAADRISPGRGGGVGDGGLLPPLRRAAAQLGMDPRGAVPALDRLCSVLILTMSPVSSRSRSEGCPSRAA
jgi:alcohol dehydrogenase-like protein